MATRYLITAAVVMLIGCAGLPGGTARTAEISVVSANGLRPVLTALAGRFETTSGDTAILTFDETGALLRRIDAGESADVYILPKSALEDLTKAGKIAPESAREIVSTTLGMAIAEGAPKPDTSTVDGFRGWLLGLNAIVMTDPAAGGIGSAHFLSVLQSLGIADAMRSRLIFTTAAGSYNAELVVAGKADAAVQLSHLIRPVRGVALVPLPAELALTVTFSAGVSPSATKPAAAARLIRFLCGPNAAPVIEAAGMRAR